MLKTSLEISLYPLGREFVPEIEDFISRIKGHKELICEVNGMSTQIFGDFRLIMDALTAEMEISFEKYGQSVFVLKIINACLKA
ncbi:MAG TPA: hypothetical protein VLH61_11080 [Bacteroidales bacterium]|nr:hypothetical protein [Bacteroidales bacterium]